MDGRAVLPHLDALQLAPHRKLVEVLVLRVVVLQVDGIRCGILVITIYDYTGHNYLCGWSRHNYTGHN